MIIAKLIRNAKISFSLQDEPPLLKGEDISALSLLKGDSTIE